MDNNYIHYQVWDDKTYPFPNLDGAEVWESIGNSSWSHTLMGMWLLIPARIIVKPR